MVTTKWSSRLTSYPHVHCLYNILFSLGTKWVLTLISLTITGPLIHASHRYKQGQAFSHGACRKCRRAHGVAWPVPSVAPCPSHSTPWPHTLQLFPGVYPARPSTAPTSPVLAASHPSLRPGLGDGPLQEHPYPPPFCPRLG